MFLFFPYLSILLLLLLRKSSKQYAIGMCVNFISEFCFQDSIEEEVRQNGGGGRREIDSLIDASGNFGR